MARTKLFEIFVIGNNHGVVAGPVGESILRRYQLSVQLQHIKSEVTKTGRRFCDLIEKRPHLLAQNGTTLLAFPAARFQFVKTIQLLTLGNLHPIEVQASNVRQLAADMLKLPSQPRVNRRLLQKLSVCRNWHVGARFIRDLNGPKSIGSGHVGQAADSASLQRITKLQKIPTA